MANRSRTRAPVRGRSPRRLNTWREIAATSTAETVPGGTILNSLDATELAKRPFTIIRTHLLIHISTDQFVASELQIGAVGICVVSQQAEAIGVTAVPTPVTDAGSDLWFLHQWIMNRNVFGTGVGFDGNVGQIYEVDSKAMRKVDEDEEVVVVSELSAVGSGYLVTVAGRLMLKEH